MKRIRVSVNEKTYNKLTELSSFNKNIINEQLKEIIDKEWVNTINDIKKLKELLRDAENEREHIVNLNNTIEKYNIKKPGNKLWYFLNKNQKTFIQRARKVIELKPDKLKTWIEIFNKRYKMNVDIKTFKEIIKEAKDNTPQDIKDFKLIQNSVTTEEL